MTKKKIKIKKRWIVLLIVLLISLILYSPVTSVLSIKNKGYSLQTAYKLYKEGLKKEVLDKDYSKTIDKIIDTDYYDEKYLNYYFEIEYIEKENFLSNINNMLTLGYNASQ